MRFPWPHNLQHQRPLAVPKNCGNAICNLGPKLVLWLTGLAVHVFHLTRPCDTCIVERHALCMSYLPCLPYLLTYVLMLGPCDVLICNRRLSYDRQMSSKSVYTTAVSHHMMVVSKLTTHARLSCRVLNLCFAKFWKPDLMQQISYISKHVADFQREPAATLTSKPVLQTALGVHLQVLQTATQPFTLYGFSEGMRTDSRLRDL